MDTSKGYIFMCSKATEIQLMRSWSILTESYNLEPNDFYFGFNPETRQNEVIYQSMSTFREHNIKFWLPRQDQLQEMVWDVPGENNPFLVLSLHDFIFDFNNEKIKEEFLDFSLEQLWLSFVMEEKYNKTWSIEKLDWVSKEN